MPRSIACAAGMLALAVLFCAPAGAVQTQTWQVRGLEPFARGELEGVSITAAGVLRLAPRQVDLPAPEAMFVWALAEDSRGNLFLGTGPKGIVYRIDSEGTLSPVLNTGQMNVHALAVGSDDTLYVGTSPDGLIYRVEADGTWSLFARTGSVYVWALAVAGEALYAATGKDGRILRYRLGEDAEQGPDRTAETLYAAQDTHVLCLLLDADRGVVAGTAPSGLIVQVERTGAVRVLFDAEQPEVHAVASAGGGRLLAVTASGGEPGAEDAGAPGAGGGAPIESAAPADSETPAPGENAIYLIDEQGTAVRALGVKQTSMFCAAQARGGLFVGTGDAGLLLRADPRAGVEILLDLPARQVLSLLVTRSDELVVGTGNGAAVLKLRQEFRPSAEYLSEPLDSRWGATWGRLSWVGLAPEKTSVAFATRSGNTPKPDATWSDWAEAVAESDGARITTVGGRSLQFRARLATDDPQRSPVVESVSLTYLPRNLPPEIKDLTLGGHPSEAPEGGEKSGESQPPSAPPARSTVVELTWTATDPNNDMLRHAVFYRREGDSLWTAAARDLDKAQHSWDTQDVPDGPYRVLVRTSDEPDNPPGLARQAEKVSELFVVDNTPPRVVELNARQEGRQVRLSGRAVDETSAVVRIEVSIDGGPWTPVRADDGMADSRQESFAYDAPPLPAGEHYFRVRASDALGNRSVARAIVRTTAP